METKITGLTELFCRSIGIEEPWYIRSIEIVKDEVHIYVDVRDKVRLPCPDCGELCKRTGYEKKERVWRHGDCVFYPCYVHCRRLRIECEKHKTKVVNAPWARKSSHLPTYSVSNSFTEREDTKQISKGIWRSLTVICKKATNT